MTKTFLYWIRYDNQSDPFSEGYIGVTCKPKARLKYHKDPNRSDNRMLYDALKNGAKMEILDEYSTYQKALTIEEEYRPTERIGWNIIPGGISPPNQTGRKNPAVSLSNRTRTVSKKTKNLMSEIRKNKLWFNDGNKNVRRYECPKGFVPGRLEFHTEESRRKISKFNKGRPKNKSSPNL